MTTIAPPSFREVCERLRTCDDYLDDISIGDRINQHIKEVLTQFEDEYGKPSVGSSRATFFVSDDEVVKVPTAWYHVYCQWVEVGYNRPGVPCAKRSMEWTEEGVPLIRMERVRVAEADEKYVGGNYVCEWMNGFHDFPQVGFNKEGKLVAFDLGYEYC